MAKELRFTPSPKGELRLDESGKTIVGYAAVFDSFSSDLGGFREVIKPGTFRKTLKESDVLAYWNHNPDIVLGRKSAGTLSLREDETGLAFTLTPPDSAALYRENILRGDVRGTSFGFRTIKDAWSKDSDGMLIRELKEVHLYEISPTANPAYPSTSANVRALLEGYGFKEREIDKAIASSDAVIEAIRKHITDTESLPIAADHSHSAEADAATVEEDEMREQANTDRQLCDDLLAVLGVKIT